MTSSPVLKIEATEFARFGQSRDEQIITYSPCGHFVAYTTDNHVVFIQNVACIQVEQHLITQQNAPIHHLTFSPCGQFLAIAAENASIQIWDCFQHRCIAEWTNSKKETVHILTYSPCGQYLGIGTETQAIIWDISQCYAICELTYDSPILTLAFSQDGTYLAIGTGHSLILWEIIPQKIIKTYTHSLPIDSLFLFGDTLKEMHLFFGETGRFFVWEPDTNHIETLLSLPETIDTIKWIDGKQKFLFVTESGTLYHYSLRPKALDQLAVLFNYELIQDIAISPCGSFCTMLYINHAIIITNLEQKIIKILQTAQDYPNRFYTLYDIAISPCGNYLAIVGLTEKLQGYGAILNAKTFDFIQQLPEGEEEYAYNGVQYFANGTFLLLTTFAGDICLIDTETFQIKKTWEVGQHIIHFAMAKDEMHLALIVAYANEDTGNVEKYQLQIWNMDPTQLIQELDLQAEMKHLTFDPMGTLFVVSTTSEQESKIWTYNWRTQVLATLLTHEYIIENIMISPCGKWLAMTGGDHTVHIIKIENQEKICSIPHQEKTYCVRFSPNGQTFVTTTEKDIFVWDPTEKIQIGRFSHDDYIYTIKYSHNGSQLFSVSQDGTMKAFSLQPPHPL